MQPLPPPSSPLVVLAADCSTAPKRGIRIRLEDETVPLFDSMEALLPPTDQLSGANGRCCDEVWCYDGI